VADLVLEEAREAPEAEAGGGRHRDHDGDALSPTMSRAAASDLRAAARSGGGRDHDDVLGLPDAERQEALREEPPEVGRVVARAVVEE